VTGGLEPGGITCGTAGRPAARTVEGRGSCTTAAVAATGLASVRNSRLLVVSMSSARIRTAALLLLLLLSLRSLWLARRRLLVVAIERCQALTHGGELG
jgi:hypothetical protein